MFVCVCVPVSEIHKQSNRNRITPAKLWHTCRGAQAPFLASCKLGDGTQKESDASLCEGFELVGAQTIAVMRTVSQNVTTSTVLKKRSNMPKGSMLTIFPLFESRRQQSGSRTLVRFTAAQQEAGLVPCDRCLDT